MASTEPDDLHGAARVAVATAMTVVAAFVAAKAARDAILLTHFAIEQLPLFLGISAVLSLPIVIGAGRMFARSSPQRLLPALNVISAALLVGEWLLLQREPRVAAVIVFLHLGSLAAVLVSGFWSIINERFDVRSAKRYAGRIGVGATLGGILGGVIAERTAVYADPGTILLVLAALQLLGAIALRTLASGATVRDGSTEEVARLAAVRTIAKVPLLRNLAVLVILGAIGAATLDYVFKAEVIAATDGRPLRTFALYHSATSIVTALVQIAVAHIALHRLGVARTVAALPFSVAAFGVLALVIPGLASAAGARGAEAITRNSIYRAGYELLFAPLAEKDKRSTKVVLDVGAERMGDLLGAQLVGILVYAAAVPRVPVIVAGIAAGVLGLVVAARVPGAYRKALETSLVSRAKYDDSGEDIDPASSLAWGPPTMSETGADRSMLSLLDLRPDKLREVVPAIPRARPAQSTHRSSAPVVELPSLGDPLLDKLLALRTRDVPRVRAVLSDIGPDLVPHVIPLLAWNEVARDVSRALSTIAPRCTGSLVDVLLDPDQEFTIRRRLPMIIAAGEPKLAAWALWRGLSDARFEVRYRCGRALGDLRGRGHALPVGEAEIHALVGTELSVEDEIMRNYRLLDGDDDKPELATRSQSTGTALAHIFNLLALVLPAEPVRIAYHGLHTDDRELRATALEYLESALPHDLAVRLWPLIEREGKPRTQTRSRDELTAALQLSAPKIEAHLATLRESTST